MQNLWIYTRLIKKEKEKKRDCEGIQKFLYSVKYHISESKVEEFE